MPISHKFKAIFVHIPKNAGESIEKTLEMYGGDPNETLWGGRGRIVLQHFTATAMKLFLKNDELWNTYFKFTVVRNPWSKAVSEYNWYLRYGPKCSFKEWVYSLRHRIEINDLIHRREIGHNIPQYKFVYSAHGECLVDRVLRFENLNDDFKKLAASRNWDVKLHYADTTKSSKRTDFREYYDADCIDEIESLYFKDIEIFGYSKENTF